MEHLSILNRKKPSKATVTIFYNSVREYFTELLNYIKGPPMKRVGIDLLKAAAVADTTRIENAKFSSVMYFIDKYPALKPSCPLQDLHREFNEYVSDEFPTFITADTYVKKTGRTETDKDIPKEKPLEERQDRRWVWLGKVIDPATASLKYSNLSVLMFQILSIPLSQASAKRHPCWEKHTSVTEQIWAWKH